MTEEGPDLIIRGPDGELDEVVAHNPVMVHIERMDECGWWIGVTFADGRYVHVNVGAKNPKAKGYATYWTEEP